MRGFAWYAAALMAAAVLAIVAVAYVANEIGPAVMANVSDEACGFVNGEPDRFDPDCIHGVWGGKPYVTADGTRWIPYASWAGGASLVLVGALAIRRMRPDDGAGPAAAVSQQ